MADIEETGRPRSSLAASLLMGFLGVGFGGLLLWLVARHVDRAQLRRVIETIAPGWVALSVAAYALSLGARSLRWRLLLTQIAPVARALVAETLLVGYAVNNILPARLGEVFRADYGRRRFGLPRSAILGSIVIERTMDGFAVLTMLTGGLLLIGESGAVQRLGALWTIAGTAAGLFLAIVAGIIGVHAVGRRHWPLPDRLLGRIRSFTDGLQLSRRVLAGAVLWSLGVWALEGVALWAMVAATGESLTVAQVMALLGAASLSTMVPTAPGYLGSYQLVFALAFRAFGLPQLSGLVAATAIQIFLFGGVAVAGTLTMLTRYGASLVTGRGNLRATPS